MTADNNASATSPSPSSTPALSTTPSSPPPCTSTAKPTSILFVCLGNICRSPMAEGVFTHLLTSLPSPSRPPITRIDSCGTGAYHVGDAPDARTMAVLAEHGISSYRHSARKFSRRDFDDFEWIMAMDEDNRDYLVKMRQRVIKTEGLKGEEAERLGRVVLWGDFGGVRGEEVIDPYYGARDGFSIAYEQMVRFSRGFLRFLEKEGEQGKFEELNSS